MGERRFVCTYTAQLQKKSKVFQDGFLIVSADGRCLSLFDSANRSCPLEVWRQSSAASVEPGDERTLERHLINVLEEEQPSTAATAAPHPFPRTSVSASLPSSLSARSSSLPPSIRPSRVLLGRPRAPLHPNAPIRPLAVATTPKTPLPSAGRDVGQGSSKRLRVDPVWAEQPSGTAPGVHREELEPTVSMRHREPVRRPQPMRFPSLHAPPAPTPTSSFQCDDEGGDEDGDGGGWNGLRKEEGGRAAPQVRGDALAGGGIGVSAWLRDDEDADDGEVVLTQPPVAPRAAGPAAQSRTTAADLLAILSGQASQLHTRPPPPPSPPSPLAARLPPRATFASASQADPGHRQPLASGEASLSVLSASHNASATGNSDDDDAFLLRATPPSVAPSALLPPTPSSALTPSSGDSHPITASPPSALSTFSLSFHSVSHTPPSADRPWLAPASPGPSPDRKPAFASEDDEDAPLGPAPPRMVVEKENRQPLRSPAEYRALAAACKSSRPAYSPPVTPPKFSDSFVAPLHYKSKAERSPAVTPTSGAKHPPLSRAASSVPLHSSSHSLRFLAGSAPPASSLTIPDTFTSISHYQSAFTSALMQQINVSLASLAKTFSTATAQWRTQREGPRNFSAPLYPCSAGQFSSKEVNRQQQDFFRSQKVPYYRRDALQMSAAADKRRKKREWQDWGKRQKGKRWGKAKLDPDEADDVDLTSDDDDGDDGDGNDECCWLFLLDPSSREKEYDRDDLFILSNQPLFGAGGAGGPGLWVMFALALYRGFSQDGGMMKVRLMGSEGHKPTIKGRTSVYAIRGPNISSPVRMLNALTSLSPSSPPILPCILRGAAWQDGAERGADVRDSSTSFSTLISNLHISPELLERVRLSVIEDFHLNPDQVDVLDRCVQWLLPPSPSSPPPSPIVLVHGAFGSGKSNLLVALLVFFHHLLTPLDPHNRLRILVASCTNVAVDGLLSSLLHRGHSWFARVGSTRRIARNILRYTVHGSQGGKGVEEQHRQAKAEVEAQMKAAEAKGDDPDGVRELREALVEMDKERGQDRKRRLMGQRVVGVTCAASTFDVLDGSVFPIVFLDESSQMIEPESLVPLARFHCQRLIAVGDPKQLPPTLQDVEGTASTSGAAAPSITSCLQKAMFERLSFAGVPTVLLRHQYRMHPTLMTLPNRLFYDSQLLNGVDAADRPSLLLARANIDDRPLPPLSFVNVAHGQEQRERAWGPKAGDNAHSCYNAAEVAAVVALVSALLRKGVPACSIGLITPYKAQWSRLRAEVARLIVRMDEEEEQRRATQATCTAGRGSLVVDDAGVLPKTDCRGTGVSGVGVQVNTVDSFQGGEKDVVILSTVKTSVTDFMDSARRINVALTRARHHLIIVGHQPTLIHSPVWKQVVTHVSCTLPGCFYPNPAALVGLMDRCALNSIAVQVSELDSSAQLRASQTNAAGSKRGQRGAKGTEGGKKKRRGKKTEREREEEAQERLRKRRAAAESDSEEEELHHLDRASLDIDRPHSTPSSTTPPPSPRASVQPSSPVLSLAEEDGEGEDDEDSLLMAGPRVRAAVSAGRAVMAHAEQAVGAASVDLSSSLHSSTQDELKGEGGKERDTSWEGSEELSCPSRQPTVGEVVESALNVAQAEEASDASTWSEGTPAAAAAAGAVSRVRRRIVEEDEEAAEGEGGVDVFDFL